MRALLAILATTALLLGMVPGAHAQPVQPSETTLVEWGGDIYRCGYLGTTGAYMCQWTGMSRMSPETAAAVCDTFRRLGTSCPVATPVPTPAPAPVREPEERCYRFCPE